MNLKSHQYSLLFLLAGVVIGACLHYLFNDQNMNYVYDKAYEEGVKDTRKEIIQGILSADTTLVTESEIEFIYK